MKARAGIKLSPKIKSSKEQKSLEGCMLTAGQFLLEGARFVDFLTENGRLDAEMEQRVGSDLFRFFSLPAF